MKQVRHNVFETNSSSTHSISLAGGGRRSVDWYPPSALNIDEYERAVLARFDEFGWGVESFTDPNIKLSYLLTMVLETECNGLDEPDKFYETEGFKKIKEAVLDYFHFAAPDIDVTDMIIENEILVNHYKRSDGTDCYSLYTEWGYIDHQSCENYASLQDFLEDYGLSGTTDIAEFIFSPAFTLVIDNDNH